MTSCSLCCAPEVDNDFILPLEKEMFIEQLKDIVDKAEDMLSEDTEGERNSDQGSSPKKSEGADVHGAEVRKQEVVSGQKLQANRSLRGAAAAPRVHRCDRPYRAAALRCDDSACDAAKNTLPADVTFGSGRI